MVQGDFLKLKILHFVSYMPND